MIPPKMPTLTTTAAVSDGMPPNDPVTSIAIGVVTDLAAKDITISCDAPHKSATITTEMMPDMHPPRADKVIGSNCFLTVDNCLYKGTPSATTAGLSQNSMYLPY